MTVATMRSQADWQKRLC